MKLLFYINIIVGCCGCKPSYSNYYKYSWLARYQLLSSWECSETQYCCY